MTQLAEDDFGRVAPVAALGITERVTVGAASAQTAVVFAPETTVIRLQADTDCFVLTGASPTAAAATSMPLVAGQETFLRVLPTDKVAVIQKTAAGFLWVTQLT